MPNPERLNQKSASSIPSISYETAMATMPDPMVFTDKENNSEVIKHSPEAYLAAVKSADIAKTFNSTVDPYTEKKIPVEAQRRPWHNAFISN